MTHYRMRDSMPSAIILAKNPKTSSLDELKTYQGNTIYLNDGNEFQIRLFNPLREKIGVQIGINGDLSESLLVLNPGEDVIVDRFLDDKSKMLFETYTIDGNNEKAVKAAADNGVVNINFFKEKKKYRSNNDFKLTFTDNQIYGNNDYGTFNTTGMVGSSTYTSNNVFFSQSLDNVVSDNLDFVSDPETKKETGRIEKGEESEQNFTKVNFEFETFSFYSLVYYLKPNSTERVKTTESIKDVREYCTNCGYRLRNNKWAFCPKCGERI